MHTYGTVKTATVISTYAYVHTYFMVESFMQSQHEVHRVLKSQLKPFKNFLREVEITYWDAAKPMCPNQGIKRTGANM